LVFLVVPIGLVQATHDLHAHRGIAGDRDDGAVMRDDLAAIRLDREVLWTKRPTSIGTVPALRGTFHAPQKLR
jgi:hypothetical protein